MQISATASRRHRRAWPASPIRRDPPDRIAAALLALVARQRGIPVGLLRHPNRCAAGVAASRQLAMYLMHVVLQRPYAEVGLYFGRDRTTVAHACAHIEDLRDEPQFDAQVTRLEAAIAALRAGETAHAAG